MGFLGGIILTAAIGFAVGIVIGRWLAVVLAGLAWPVSSLGVWIGAWGHGFGHDDTGWTIAAFVAILTAAAIAGAMLGVLARRRTRFTTPTMLRKT
jgi:hypothetical protein